MLLLLKVYNTLDNYLISLYKYGTLLYRNINEAFSIKSYFLFEGISAPFHTSHVNIGASSSAVPSWYYLPEDKTFVEWSLETPITDTLQTKGRSLPILSMEIIENDRVVYDLTDFIGDIKVYNIEEAFCPSIAHILGAWFLSSSIVLDHMRDFKVSMIYTDTRMEEKSCFSSDGYAYISMEEPIAPSTSQSSHTQDLSGAQSTT